MIRRRPLRWLLLWLLACAASAQASPRLHLSETGLSPEQVTASQELFEDTLARLPPAWRQSLPPAIAVAWRDDLPAGVHGRATGQRLLLRRELLDGWMGRDRDIGIADPATRAALAALIHELAHLHDRSTHGRLSHDPRLRDLAGWQVRPFRLLPRQRSNAFRDRSPDPYELTSPAEYVAVNLEHFILDPAHACRRPALHRYFADHFGFAPPGDDCPAGLPFIQPGDSQAADGDASWLLTLDPEQVYEIDYLLAEGNDQMMSRWGHSMLRLVTCAPGRPRGPDCRLDLQHHLVLSFRAFVDDVQISSLRGLTGSYPSRLFVLPLDQVIDEYTRVELRGLRSLPLALDRAEIAAVLERAAQLHWSYDGRYYFVTNNCAVETFKLLHDSTPRLSRARLHAITPNGLLRRLKRAGLATAAVPDNPEDAIRLGHYFAPANAHYRELFDIARASLDLPQARVEDWLALTPQARAPWLGHADLHATAALLVLEQAALRREELLARNALKQRLSGRRADPSKDAADARDALHEALRLEGLLTRPAQLLHEGYGLPLQAEHTALLATGERQLARWREHHRHLHEHALAWLSPQRRQALEDGRANLDMLGERLRALHREAGGLEL